MMSLTEHSENMSNDESELLGDDIKDDSGEFPTYGDGNEYGYLDKNTFSSEIFKIVISNLPRRYGIAELKKLLTKKLNLGLRKIKLTGHKRTNRWLYACFDSKEEQTRSVEVLNNYMWKRSLLQAKLANPAPDPLIKRKNLETGDGPDAKRFKVSTSEDLDKAIKKAASPWCDIPYAEQISLKSKSASSLLQKFSYDVIKANPVSVDYISKQKELNSGMPCKFYPCKGLENNCNFYRNKCEFSIGLNAMTKEIIIGFRIGSYAAGSVDIAPINSLKIVNERMVNVVEVFERFIKSHDFQCYSPITRAGQWGQLTVRIGTNTDELMLIVGLHKKNCNLAQREAIKKELILFFTEGEGKRLNLTSLYVQLIIRKKPNREPPEPELLIGKYFIQEELCGLKFKISPYSFFQVNTKCAELLIENIKEMAKVNKKTTILDVCCGTGTLGLCLAKECGQVLGLERDYQAIIDAKENAARNEIVNCEFFCGLADEIIHSVICRSVNDEIIAILDPPRAGLHAKAIQLLRKTEKINKIIFLSCDPKLAYRNFVDLCKTESKTMAGPPFYLVSAVPIDMFPHTERYELILYFERENILNIENK